MGSYVFNLQKTVTSVKHNKLKCNKMRYVCSWQAWQSGWKHKDFILSIPIKVPEVSLFDSSLVHPGPYIHFMTSYCPRWCNVIPSLVGFYWIINQETRSKIIRQREIQQQYHMWIKATKVKKKKKGTSGTWSGFSDFVLLKVIITSTNPLNLISFPEESGVIISKYM